MKYRILQEKKIRRLRCDNGSEYLNSKIYRLARLKGFQTTFKLRMSFIRSFEHYNKTIMNTARCLLAEANVERKFWLECIMTAAYLLNRSLINKSRNKTPYKIFFGKKPSAKNLRLYGSRVFVRVPEEKRSSKWKERQSLELCWDTLTLATEY